MFRVFFSLTVLGFLLGLVATPVFAGSLETQASGLTVADARDSDEAEIGAALSGMEAAPNEDSVAGIRSVSDQVGTSCMTARCMADPDNARRILGALLASMGTLETQPDTEPGLPTSSR